MFDTSYLLTSLVFSSIGLGYFIYGKKQKHKIVYYTGLGLMFYPYFVTAIPAMIVSGVGLMVVPKIVKYLGYD